MKAKVLKIPARGGWSFAEVDADEHGVLPLDVLQGAVGGWIECVWLGEAGFPDLDMFVNEEGKLHGLSFNVVASALSEILAQGDCLCTADPIGNDRKVSRIDRTCDQAVHQFFIDLDSGRKTLLKSFSERRIACANAIHQHS